MKNKLLIEKKSKYSELLTKNSWKYTKIGIMNHMNKRAIIGAFEINDIPGGLICDWEYRYIDYLAKKDKFTMEEISIIEKVNNIMIEIVKSNLLDYRLYHINNYSVKTKSSLLIFRNNLIKLGKEYNLLESIRLLKNDKLLKVITEKFIEERSYNKELDYKLDPNNFMYDSNSFTLYDIKRFIESEGFYASFYCCNFIPAISVANNGIEINPHYYNNKGQYVNVVEFNQSVKVDKDTLKLYHQLSKKFIFKGKGLPKYKKREYSKEALLNYLVCFRYKTLFKILIFKNISRTFQSFFDYIKYYNL